MNIGEHMAKIQSVEPNSVYKVLLQCDFSQEDNVWIFQLSK